MTERTAPQAGTPPESWGTTLMLLAGKGLSFGSFIDLGCADGHHGLVLWQAGILRNATIINIDANPLYEPSLKKIQSVIGGHYRICAIAGHTGTIDMHSSAHPYWASAAEVGSQYWGSVNQQIGEPLTVPCQTLDSLIDEMAPKPPYIIKLDIQGLEARALRSGPRTLASTAVVICEIFMTDFREINAVIEQAGFDLYDLTNLHRTDDHRLGWLDAVYLHRNHAPLSSPQIWAKERNASILDMQDQRRKAILSHIDSLTNLAGTFTGAANLSDTKGGTLKGAGATWILTGPNTGSVTNLSGTFAGMANLSDAGAGTLKNPPGSTWTLTGPNTGSVTNLSGTFAGMANLTDTGSR